MLAVGVVLTSAGSAAFVAQASTSRGAQGPRLSKEAFLASGNTACRRGVKKLYSLPKPRSLKEYIAQLNGAITLYADLISEIGRLRPPQASERAVNQMLTAFEEAGKTLKQVRDATIRGDQAAANAAVKAGEKPALRAGELAFKIGLKDCTLPG